MSDRTAIQWTDASWNPIAAFDRKTGKRGWFCTRVSEGCEHCYAEQMNTWRGNGHLYRVPNLDKVELRLLEHVLVKPLSWREPRRIFVCSMTDLFLDAIPDEWIDRVFAIMALAPQHTFQVLTKRPARMLAYMSSPGRAGAIAAETGSGVDGTQRLPFIRPDDLAARWPLKNGEDGCDPPIPGIDWCIVGGESGAKARPCDTEWIADILAQCCFAGVPAFVKQMGSRPTTPDLTHWRCGAELLPDASGYALTLRDSHGGDPEEWPEELRVREFPARGVRA